MINFGVTKKKNESIDKLLNRFKKKTKDSNLMERILEKKYFIPESHKRKIKKQQKIYLNEKNTD